MNGRMFHVSYSVPDAYEVWSIELTPEGQEEYDQTFGDDPDEQAVGNWLHENPDLWEYSDLKDSGGTDMTDFQLEEIL